MDEVNDCARQYKATYLEPMGRERQGVEGHAQIISDQVQIGLITPKEKVVVMGGQR